MLAAELAHQGEVDDLVDVEDQHVRAVRLQHDRDAVVLEVLRDHGHARVVREHGSKAEPEEVLEARDGDGDRGRVRPCTASIGTS